MLEYVELYIYFLKNNKLKQSSQVGLDLQNVFFCVFFPQIGLYPE